MERKLDLRVQKTYRALTGSFMTLLERKRFEDITVNELCDLALVRRATFYKHFGDKYEFFAFFVREIRDRFWQTQTSGRMPCEEIARCCLDFLDAHERLVQSVMKSDAFPLLLDILSDQIVRDVQALLREQQGLPLPPEVLAQAYTGALIYVCRWWIAHKNTLDKETMLREFTSMMEKMM